MDVSTVVSQLEAHGAIFQNLLRATPVAQQGWRPAAGSWSLLEVVCHLHDEERDDFRARLRSVLNDPTEDIVLVDPEGWVQERRYAEQDFATQLDRLCDERAQSIRWLRGLEQPSWENAYEHPKFGALSARMFLVNWLAHDHLHIRQINRLKYQYLQAHAEVRLDYAGDW